MVTLNSWISACWCCSQSILIQIVKNGVSARVANAWFYIDFDYNLNCWLHAEGGDFVPIMAAGLFCCIGGLLTMDISCQLSSLVITSTVCTFQVPARSSPGNEAFWWFALFYMANILLVCKSGCQLWLSRMFYWSIYICRDNVFF